MNKQSKMDSFLESISNVAVGFFISWATWVFVVDPLFGFNTAGGTSFLITMIFTITSIIRSYVLRRIFNGRTIWQFAKEKFA